MLIDLKNMLLMIFAITLILIIFAMDSPSNYKEKRPHLNMESKVNHTIVVKLH